MTPPMPDAPRCPQCGTPLPTGALAGLCPACLLKMGAATDTLTDAKQPAFQPPTVAELAPLFPQLEILELIGKGGMGAVYKARQKQLDRIVALKILPPGIGHDAAFAERFTREAKALAKLNHPGIVTLYEFGNVENKIGATPTLTPSLSHPMGEGGRRPGEGSLFFFLMEYVNGVNLRQLLAGSRVSAREALAIVPQICDALQFAHDQGIVHRDIKPENILLDRRGRVKVADFGLAKIVGHDAPLTPSLSPSDGERVAKPGEGTPVLTDAGRVLGTPQYMSPEQIQAPGEVDHRADIYALGVVFYQMLTGELPGKRFVAPSSKVQIDVRLDEVVLRALEKNPALRYQQVSEVKTLVETIAATPGSAAAPAAPVDAPSTGTAGKAFAGASNAAREARALPEPARKSSTGKIVAIGCGVVAGGGCLVLMLILVGFIWLRAAKVQTVRSEREAMQRAVTARTLTGPPFVARMYQAKVELLVLADQPWTNTVGWQPDGQASAVPFPIDHGSMNSWAEGKVTKKIAFRIWNESPEGMSYPVGRTDDASGVSATGSSLRPAWKRQPVTEFIQLICCPTNAQTMNISLGLANGAWETAVTLGKGGSAASGDWSATCNAVTGHSDVAVGCTYSKYEDWESRMVYVDDHGKVVPIQENMSHAGDNPQTGATLLVSSNEYAHIKEFQLQRRKYQWAEFLNVSLQPGHATTVTVKDSGENNPAAPTPPAAAPALAFGPVVERVILPFDESSSQACLDMGSGKFHSPPTDLADRIRLLADNGSGQPFTDLNGPGDVRYDWLKTSGVDLIGGLTSDGHAKFKYLGQPPHWQTGWASFDGADAEKVVQMLKSSPFYAGDKPNLPAVYVNDINPQLESVKNASFFLFRTHDGDVGIMQVLGESQNPRGVKLRYKLVQNIVTTATLVSMAPAVPAAAPALAFGPVVERVLPDQQDQGGPFINFENGELVRAPNGLVENRYDRTLLMDWLIKAGADACEIAGENGGHRIVSYTRDTCFSEVSPSSWEGMNESGLLYAWQSAARINKIDLGNPDLLPRTFVFETRSGLKGLLQITGFTENPRGVKLRYKLVQPQATPAMIEAALAKRAARDVFQFRWVAADDDTTSPVDLLPDPSAGPGWPPLRVLRDVVLSSLDVESAGLTQYQSEQKTVEVFLTLRGGEKFAQATAQNIGHRLAIIWRGKVISAPVVQSEISTGRGQITGRFTDAEAQQLLDVLNHRVSSKPIATTSELKNVVLPGN